jgi:phosphatidylglycerophosphatase A
MAARAIAALPPLHPAMLVATWFGVGRLPWAPGSWGSLAALPFAWAITQFLGPSALALAAAALFVIGWWAAERVTRASGVKDDGAIVVDEVAGQWLALSVAPLDPFAYLAALLLFRLFDIAKPWPVRWADREVAGGLGVMLDDAIAGLYAGVSLFILLRVAETFFGY